jgi:hypothetical protein
MPTLRATAAALLMGVLLLLQGAVLDGGVACALVAQRAQSGAHHAGAHHAGAHHAAAATTHASVPHDGGDPVPASEHGPMHCAATGACASFVATTSAVVLHEAALAMTRADAGDFSAPASRRAAPEPPPPRA